MWRNPDAMDMPVDMVSADQVFEARKLLRAARSATLATSAEGQPFASLVTPATAPDLAILMLLSSLSAHTRHLVAEPRCAVMVVGEATGTNPQTAPRATVTGLAEQVPAEEVPALKARWLACHPYAALYADFGDFALWRMRPGGALLVGGFARAQRLRGTELAPDAEAVAAIAAAEADICEHMNADHADTLPLLAGPPPAEPWRMMAVDVDGFDIASGEHNRRLAFPAPVGSAEAVRMALIALIRAARAKN